MSGCLALSSSQTSNASSLVEISLSSVFHHGGLEVARGDAGKRLVIFNLHTAVMGCSKLSADVIPCVGPPLWPPGGWEDRGRKKKASPWWEHYHCSSMMNVGRHFSEHVCTYVFLYVLKCGHVLALVYWMTAASCHETGEKSKKFIFGLNSCVCLEYLIKMCWFIFLQR